MQVLELCSSQYPLNLNVCLLEDFSWTITIVGKHLLCLWTVVRHIMVPGKNYVESAVTRSVNSKADT